MSVSKKRALTKILRSVGDEAFQESTRSETMARLVWDLACTGAVTFPDGREVKASVKDWKDTVQWIYTHVDGAARVEQLVTMGMEGQLAETPLAELQRIVSGALTLPAAEDAEEVAEDTEDS